MFHTGFEIFCTLSLSTKVNRQHFKIFMICRCLSLKSKFDLSKNKLMASISLEDDFPGNDIKALNNLVVQSSLASRAEFIAEIPYENW